MTKILTASHAEDLGGFAVEPGAEIPANADKAIVKRLEAEGRITDVKASSSSSSKKEE